MIRKRTGRLSNMRLTSLIRLWLWSTAMAIAAFAVLYVVDTRLRAATGFGTADLQSVRTADAFNAIIKTWTERGRAATAGFNLGFDYLFMPLYAMSFYLSAILAREAFAPKRGVWRRTLDYLGFVPLIGALLDATENALEFSMLTGAADDGTAYAAYLVSSGKWSCVAVGLLLLVGGIAGVIKLRMPKKEEEG
jgi:hypothetical protein